MLTLTFVSLLGGCENIAEQLYYTRTGVDDVVDIGEMRAVEIEEYWQTYLSDGAILGGYGAPGDTPDTSIDTWYNLVQTLGGEDTRGRKGIYYGELGAGDPGTFGGATFTFKGTGTKLCIVVDPEAIFWNQQISQDVTAQEYTYADHLDDDGDIDTYAGLSAYYTGDPGNKMGDFEVPYQDAQGQNIYIAFDECARQNNGIEVHAGRASAEWCEIDTTTTVGKEYTVALDTFALPTDDSILSFGVAVFEVGEGGCLGTASGASNVETAHPPIDGAQTECVLPAEWSGGVPDGSPLPRGERGGCDDQEAGTWTWECLEREFCDTKSRTKNFNAYCATHLYDTDAPCISNEYVPTDTGG